MNTLVHQFSEFFRSRLEGQRGKRANDRYYDEAWKVWGIPSDARVLEIAPGSTSGRDAFEWSRRLDGGHLTYFDARRGLAEALNQLAQERGFANLVAVDALPDGEFDAVIVFGALNYVVEPIDLLRVAASRLKAGGLLALGGTTRPENALQDAWESCARVALGNDLGELSAPNMAPYHSYHTQIAALCDTGFRVEKLCPVRHLDRRLAEPPHPAWLRQALGNEVVLNAPEPRWMEHGSDAFLLRARKGVPLEVQVNVGSSQMSLEDYHAAQRRLYSEVLCGLGGWEGLSVLAVEPSRNQTVNEILGGLSEVMRPRPCSVRTITPRETESFKFEGVDRFVLWGACQRVADLPKLLRASNARDVVIMDCVVPEAVRDWWSWASWVKDPETLAHRTWHEYLGACRESGFEPVHWIPIRHRNSIEGWTKTMGKSECARLEKRLRAAPRHVRVALEITETDFVYDSFVLLARNVEVEAPTS